MRNVENASIADRTIKALSREKLPTLEPENGIFFIYIKIDCNYIHDQFT